MYYDEKLIDGYWCWKNDPKGPWTRFTLEEMGEKFNLLMQYTGEKCKRLAEYQNNELNLG
jgi:hypothetical protein